MHKIIMLLIMLIATATVVTAIQPTQQYYKSYIDPFYRVSMAVNTNYTYSLIVNPPDGISSVTSAIINFNGQINGQTQTFTLWVNGQSCNNPTYSVATAFSTTGNAQFAFDCSNRITTSGNYTITLRSAVATGAMQGWLDLTYMNSPSGALELHGTEYIVGDDGKMFLQFLDANNQPVNNSECFLSMWYPNNTVIYRDTLMNKLEDGLDGIYYKNFVVPNVNGVYPASAKCYRPLTFYNIFRYVTDNFESNTFTGGIGWSNDSSGVPPYGWDYYAPSAGIASTGCLSGTYCAYYTGQFGYIERGFIPDDGAFALNITLSFKTTLYGSGDALDFEFFNGNWRILDQSTTANITNGVWYNRSYYITGISLDTILLYLGQTVTASNRRVDIDNVNITIFYPNISVSNITDYQVLRGSGEVHVSKLYTQLNSSQLTAEQVWNHTTRNLTYYPPQVDMTNYTRIDDTVYAINNSIIARINTLEVTLIGYFNNISLNVWNYATRTLTAFGFDNTNYTRIQTDVWNATTRNLTYYENFTQAQLDLTNYSLINEGVWSYNTRNLTYYEHVDMTNYTTVAVNVWTYITRNLTYYPPTTTAQEIWEYNTRNLTYYPTQLDLTNYSLINEGVWSYNVRNLTYYEDKTNYTQILDTIPTAVWTYITRNLTYYPDTANASAISSEVWDYAARYTHGVIIN